MALRDAVKKLDEMFDDLSSLHVQTYTGKVDFDLDPTGPDDDRTRVDRLRDAVTSIPAGGAVQLVAEAYYQFDGDSYNFLTSEDVPAKALDLHNSAVEAGIKTRQALLELAKDALKG